MSERANLLYLHSDQHSPFVAGCYGDGLVHTPNLDRLAARGVVLDTCYCPSPLCVPSRMSALTGRHPFENEVWTNSHVLDSAIPTLAHSMGAGGYRPVLIGRMHALGPDQLHGYAERLVGDHGPNHLGGRGVDHGELTGTAGPARVMGPAFREYATLAPGTAADIVLFDPDREWQVDTAEFQSMGKNTPLEGVTLKGQVMATMVGGRLVFEHSSWNGGNPIG